MPRSALNSFWANPMFERSKKAMTYIRQLADPIQRRVRRVCVCVGARSALPTRHPLCLRLRRLRCRRRAFVPTGYFSLRAGIFDPAARTGRLVRFGRLGRGLTRLGGLPPKGVSHSRAENEAGFGVFGHLSVLVCRRLRIATVGAANTVVWNPWIAKSAVMLDFGDDEWPGMLCVEAGNVLDHAVSLEPGRSETLRYRLAVEAS